MTTSVLSARMPSDMAAHIRRVAAERQESVQDAICAAIVASYGQPAGESQ